LTSRELGAVGIKLIGVFFAVSGVIRLVGVVASTALPQVEGLPNAGAIVRLNALVILVELAVAAACLFGGEFLGDRLFSGRRYLSSDVSRETLLVVGLALLGVSNVAAAAPDIIQFAGRAIWFAQGSRQAQFLPSMEQSWQRLSERVLELIVGGALVIKAGRIGSALARLYQDRSEHEHAG
jgi:hypothetical protein